MRKHLPLSLAVLCAGAFLFPSAAFAQSGEPVANGGFGLGLGWAGLDDNVEDIAEGGDGGSGGGFLALVQYRGEAWEVEFDYIFGDDSAWVLSGDYIFNFDRDLNDPYSGAYAGIGYSYISVDSGDGSTTEDEDDDDTDSGINVMLGFDVDQNWGVEGRYIFSDSDLFTIAVNYNFGADDQSY